MKYLRGSKNIGQLEGGVLTKIVKKSKHLFRSKDAWGIDYDLLNGLPDDVVIKIYDKEEKKEYSTTKGVYWSHGEIVDYGYSKQVLLSRDKFI